MSVNLKCVDIIRNLVASISAVTGESHSNLTEAVQTMKNAYGQGGDNKFKEYNAGTLTEVNAEDFGDATQIRSYQFVGLTSLVNVEIPNAITNIGSGAFNGCTGIQRLRMPISATLGTNAFNNVTGIKTMIFNVGTSVCPNYTSSNYKTTPWYISRANVSEIIIQEGVTTIGTYAFADLTALTNVYIPSTVTEIGYYAFRGCSELTKVALPSGITKLNNSLFQNCSKLTSVSIPKSVTEIGDMVFYSCSALTDIYYEGTEEEWNAIKLGDMPGLDNADAIHYNSTGLPE